MFIVAGCFLDCRNDGISKILVEVYELKLSILFDEIAKEL